MIEIERNMMQLSMVVKLFPLVQLVLKIILLKMGKEDKIILNDILTRTGVEQT